MTSSAFDTLARQLGLSDNLTVSVAFGLSLDDSITLADSPEIDSGFFFVDSIPFLDNISSDSALAYGISDSLLLLDLAEGRISYIGAVDETLQLADETTVSIGLLSDRKVPYHYLIRGLRGF